MEKMTDGWESLHTEGYDSEVARESASETDGARPLDYTTVEKLEMDSYDEKKITEAKDKAKYFEQFKFFLEEIKNRSFINTENKAGSEKKYTITYQPVEFAWGGKKFIYTSDKNRDRKYIIDPENIKSADNDQPSLIDLKTTILKLHEFILSENPYGRLSLQPKIRNVEKPIPDKNELGQAGSKEEVKSLIFESALKKTFLETPKRIQFHFVQAVLIASYGLRFIPKDDAIFNETAFTIDGVHFTYKFDPKHKKFAEGVLLTNSEDQVASFGILNEFSKFLYDRKVKAILKCLDKFTIKELLPKITNLTDRNTTFEETRAATPEQKAYIKMQEFIDQKKELERVIELDEEKIINETEILNQNTPNPILEDLSKLREDLESKLSVISEKLPDLLQEFHIIRADGFHSRHVENTIAIIKNTINSYDFKNIKNFTTVMEQFLISSTINLVEPSPANDEIKENIEKSITLLKAISEKCEKFSESYPNQKITESLKSYHFHKKLIEILIAEQLEHEFQLETVNQQLEKLKLLTSA